MFRCGTCGNLFETPIQCKELRHYPNYYETWNGCPACYSWEIFRVVNCDCGHMSDQWIQMPGGEKYCLDCVKMFEIVDGDICERSI